MTAPREGNDGATNGRVLKWLPLVVVAMAGAAAWGSQITTTEQHDRRITHNEKVLEKLTEMQSRIDERTLGMSKDVKENKTLILEILRELRNGKAR